MAGRFPAVWLDELFARTDIVQIVSSYVALKQDGHRYWGLCPFHNEKTPSFSVSPDLNLYYCFGCKAGGNTIQFLMNIENIDFYEAATELAERVNLPLPQVMDEPDYYVKKSQRDRLFEINKEAARYYHQNLWQPSGNDVLKYFYKRGLTDGVIRKFGLGASPDAWDHLLRHLIDAGFQQEDIESAGLCVRNEKGVYDMFRGRAMFPIINSNGQVLGFGGRVLDKSQPKYLNTSDTPIFNKRLGVYAANLLKKERSLQRVILVEGYMDVISLSSHGVKGVVATLGTSLTAEQARLLKRYAPEVWIAYDGDAAGQHAIQRALGIFESEGVRSKVLFFPDDLDPDEFIGKYGLDAFQALRPLSATEYRLQTEKKGYDLSDERERLEYAKKAALIIGKLQEPVEQDFYISKLAKETGFSKEVIAQQVGITGTDEIDKNARTDKPRLYPRKNEQSNGKELLKTQRILLSLYATHLLPQDMVREDDFSDEISQNIFMMMKNGTTPEEIVMSSEDPLFRDTCGLVFFESNRELTVDEAIDQASDCLNTLRIIRYENMLTDKKKRYETADAADKQQLLQDIVTLTKELSVLKLQRNRGGNFQ